MNAADSTAELASQPPVQSFRLGELIEQLGPRTVTLLGPADPNRLVLGAEFHDPVDELTEQAGTLLIVSAGAHLHAAELKQCTERRTLNSMVPIWQRSKGDVSDEDCAAFYKEKFHDSTEPAAVICETASFAASQKSETEKETERSKNSLSICGTPCISCFAGAAVAMLIPL